MEPSRGITSALVEQEARTIRALVDAALASHDDDPTLELRGQSTAAPSPHRSHRTFGRDCAPSRSAPRRAPDVVVARGFAKTPDREPIIDLNPDR
jgi:hypothetical protein